MRIKHQARMIIQEHADFSICSFTFIFHYGGVPFDPSAGSVLTKPAKGLHTPHSWRLQAPAVGAAAMPSTPLQPGSHWCPGSLSTVLQLVAL